MKASQFRELSEEELVQKLSDLQDDLFKLRIRHSVAKLENPMKIREARKDIARVQAVIAEHRMDQGKKTARKKAPAEAEG